MGNDIGQIFDTFEKNLANVYYPDLQLSTGLRIPWIYTPTGLLSNHSGAQGENPRRDFRDTAKHFW